MGSRLRLEPHFYLVVAAAILFIPLRWLFAWMAAVFTHELCHIMMLKVLGCSVRTITIGPNGAIIHTHPIEPSKEFLCAAAGPAGSFMLLLLARWMPLVAVCGFLQGCYNLLPMTGMDGGRMVSCLLRSRFDASLAEKAEKIIDLCIMAALLAISLYCMIFLSLGPLPLMFVLFLAVKQGKIPCKTRNKRVQ